MTFMAKMSPRGLAATFGAFHLTIFLLAWNNAKDLTGPWYNAEVSQWAYLGYLLASAAILAGLAAAMVQRTNFIDRKIGLLERRATASAYPPTANNPSDVRMEPPPPKDRVDKDIDDLLESLSEMEVTTAVEAQMEEVGIEVGPPAAEAPPDTAAERTRLDGMRRQVRAYIAGPAAVAVLFLGISGAMLPGTGGFLQTYHQLNTFLILGMGYGWIGLGAYVIAAVSGAVRGA